MEMTVLSSIDEVDAAQWNRLHQSDNPFIQHQFLAALERHGCVSERFGWIPRHLLFHQETELVAAVILYEKHNNYGEFVFDHSWEQAWQSIGLDYYPKLVSAAPYTPARGSRILIAKEVDDSAACLREVSEQLKTFCAEHDYSGVHLLFSDEQAELAQQEDMLVRHDVQFQWFNQNYQSFDDYLMALKAKKRKNIRQERRAVMEQGITFKVMSGEQTSEQDWQEFDFFYQKTFIEKWSTPTLNLAFFQEIAKTMPEHIVLVLAQKEGITIAGALMFRSNTVLYGRHWGCGEEVKHLHFETCFYQGIEYAIEHGLSRFEPGAGGEHKISRGFIPVLMQSSHWLSLNPFVEGMERFLAEEHKMITQYAHSVWQQSPYQDNQPFQQKASQAQKLAKGA